MSSTTASASSSSGELDERVLAKASLDAAEELLQSLCASHAGTFVSVERRARTMQQGLEDLLTATKAVQIKLQKAQEALEHEEGGTGSSSGGEGGDVSADSSNINSNSNNNKSHTSTIAILSEKHRVRRRTLLQHSSLLELLELPSLMDACVRSNLYEEALSIAAFANTLERRHYNNKSSTSSSSTAADTGTSATGQQQQQQQVIVVARVIEQIRSRQVDLRRHLLHRLKTTVTMPECLEVVTALRRLNSIALERRQQQMSNNANNDNATVMDLERVHAAMELRLQVDFLEARDFWLETNATTTTNQTSGNASSTAAMAVKGTTSSLATATTSSEEDLLDTIERYRTRVFEVATQFNAIFRAQASSSSAAALGGASSSSSSSSNADSVALLLSMWTSRRVYAFLTLLQAAQTSATAGTASLSAGSNHSGSGSQNNMTTTAGTNINNAGMLLPDASSLRDALEASIFFASSMGRLGADFTAQLPAIFEPRMHDIVVSYWKDGAKQLNETLTVCREAGVATPLLVAQSQSSSQRDIMMESSSSSDTAAGGGTSSSALLKMHWSFSETTVGVEGPQASAPRQVLMAMPPMARLVNAVLMGLNELRRCLLPGIFSRLRSSLQTILQDEILSTILTKNQRAVMVPGLRGDAAGLRHVATLYKQVMTEVVIPYCLGSLEAALGNHEGAVEYYKTAQENMKVPEPVQEEKEEEKEQVEDETEQAVEGTGISNNEVNATGSDADAQEVEQNQEDEQPTGQEELKDD